MKLKKVTHDGKCAVCGSADLMLAQDQTQYTRHNFENGKWEPGGTDTEAGCLDDSVRFFCTDCGEEHEVPDELT